MKTSVFFAVSSSAMMLLLGSHVRRTGARPALAWMSSLAPARKCLLGADRGGSRRNQLMFPPLHSQPPLLALLSTIAPTEEESSVASLPGAEGRVVAEGVVVSKFSGGLYAVRVRDEWTEDIGIRPVGTPGIVPPMSSTSTGSELRTHQSDMSGDLMGRNVVFSDGTKGIVVAYRTPVLFALVDSATSPASTEQDVYDKPVKVLDSMASLPPLGVESQVIDCFGRDMEMSTSNSPTHTRSSKEGASRAIFAPIPLVSDISLIDKPLLTGVTMIDTLAPIGRGQNMLMVGDDVAELRGFVYDMLQTQLRNDGSKPLTCVYADIDTPVDELKENLALREIDGRVRIVGPRHLSSASSSTSSDDGVPSRAAEAVAIAASACAIAESVALSEGADTLVIVDTIDWHKKMWDVTTRVLVDVFGIDSVVRSDRSGGASSEMRAFFSTLIQRSAQVRRETVMFVLACC
jgi:hypothetical protein